MSGASSGCAMKATMSRNAVSMASSLWRSAPEWVSHQRLSAIVPVAFGGPSLERPGRYAGTASHAHGATREPEVTHAMAAAAERRHHTSEDEAAAGSSADAGVNRAPTNSGWEPG